MTKAEKMAKLIVNAARKSNAYVEAIIAKDNTINFEVKIYNKSQQVGSWCVAREYFSEQDLKNLKIHFGLEGDSDTGFELESDHPAAENRIAEDSNPYDDDSLLNRISWCISIYLLALHIQPFPCPKGFENLEKMVFGVETSKLFNTSPHCSVEFLLTIWHQLVAPIHKKLFNSPIFSNNFDDPYSLVRRLDLAIPVRCALIDLNRVTVEEVLPTAYKIADGIEANLKSLQKIILQTTNQIQTPDKFITIKPGGGSIYHLILRENESDIKNITHRQFEFLRYMIAKYEDATTIGIKGSQILEYLATQFGNIELGSVWKDKDELRDQAINVIGFRIKARYFLKTTSNSKTPK